jgi:hypothetical protein
VICLEATRVTVSTPQQAQRMWIPKHMPRVQVATTHITSKFLNLAQLGGSAPFRAGALTHPSGWASSRVRFTLLALEDPQHAARKASPGYFHR